MPLDLTERLVRLERADDPRLHDYVGLTDMQLRTRTEPEAGLFIAEGEKVIARAVDAGYPMRSMLLSDKWLPVMGPVLERTSAPVYVGANDLLEEVTGFHVHRGALAAACAFGEGRVERRGREGRRVVHRHDRDRGAHAER